MIRSTTIRLALCLILVRKVMGDKRCYWPDGSFATGYYQCNPNDNVHSACCGSGDVCLDNGLCFWQQQGSFYRNACTDSKYADSSCPQKCLGDSSVANSQSAPAQLVHCTGFGRWCCGAVPLGNVEYNSSCCDEASSSTTTIDFEALVRIPVTNTLLGNIHDNITTSVNTTSNYTTISCPSSNSSSLLTNATTASCGHDKAVGIGIGAGSVAGVVLIVSVAALIWMRLPWAKRHHQAPAYNYFHKTDIPLPQPPSPPSHYQSTHPLMELSVINNLGVYEVGAGRVGPYELNSAHH